MHTFFKNLLNIALFLSIQVSFATTHLLTVKTNVSIYDSKNFSYAPGDTFYIPSSTTIGGLRFIDFKGSESKPLVIMNENGQVTISESKYQGILFLNCHYIHLTGTGSSQEYGINIIKTGSGSVGVGAGGLSSDVEIDHIEISNTGFAGIMAKTDPQCDDEDTWRRNGFVFKNLHIHHNYIHDTEGEGMYIGYTGGFKVVSKKICNDEMVFGHLFENIDVHDNLVKNAGWDGIQVGMAAKNGLVHHNTIINYGLEKVKFQNFGMNLGSGNIQAYHNYIENSPQYAIDGSLGIQYLSVTGGSYLIGNVIVNTGNYGIFMHNRHKFDSNEGYYVLNNTIINPGQSDPASGIFYNACITTSDDEDDLGDCQTSVHSYFYNNLVVNPGIAYEEMSFWKKENENYLDFNTKALRDASLNYRGGNYFTKDINSLKLTNPDQKDYSIKNNFSPLFNTGEDVSSYPILSTDIDGQSRLFYGVYDIGAYEYVGPILATNIETLSENSFRYTVKNNSLVFYNEIHQLEIYSLQGKQLKTMSSPSSPVALSLPVGVYIMRVSDNNGFYTQKLIIQE